MMKKIPVVLMTDSPVNDLESNIQNHEDFLLLETISTNEIDKISIHKKKYYDLLVLIDTIDMEIRVAVITSLLLRNHGEQVFITCSEDFLDLCEVTRDIHKFIAEEAPKGPIRTEIIITEHAQNILGDIKLIVEEFERNYLH